MFFSKVAFEMLFFCLFGLFFWKIRCLLATFLGFVVIGGDFPKMVILRISAYTEFSQRVRECHQLDAKTVVPWVLRHKKKMRHAHLVTSYKSSYNPHKWGYKPIDKWEGPTL